MGDVESGPVPVLDPERHFLDGSRGDVAAYLLALDAINFGSGWFPTLRKREGCSGYFTVAWALADRWRADGPEEAAERRSGTPGRCQLCCTNDQHDDRCRARFRSEAIRFHCDGDQGCTRGVHGCRTSAQSP